MLLKLRVVLLKLRRCLCVAAPKGMGWRWRWRAQVPRPVCKWVQLHKFLAVSAATLGAWGL